LYPENYPQIAGSISNRVKRILHVADGFDLEQAALMATETEGAGGAIHIIASPSVELLARARQLNYQTCLRSQIDDEIALHQAIAAGREHDYLLIRFKDPTNIPLELVIASLQASNTVLLKEMSPKDDVEEAVVALGVMEVGPDGVMFTPNSHHQLSRFMERIDNLTGSHLQIQEGRIVRTKPLGLGTRSCIDATTLFSPTEGMLVGSTSSGGLLCCAEVFFLPYMDLRPFRVNAGSVHSYVFNLNDKTDYMSELRAGSSLMIVDAQGKARRTFVGRMKTEVRPLRLIEAEFEGGRRVNVIMQDDWHVRIFSDKALPLNITELQPGQKVLGHVTESGRHVGIRVQEQIQES
jgi:3-dehydroquinate synthase II/3-amino-4-hydroxybenzoic acid synthase